MGVRKNSDFLIMVLFNPQFVCSWFLPTSSQPFGGFSVFPNGTGCATTIYDILISLLFENKLLSERRCVYAEICN